MSNKILVIGATNIDIFTKTTTPYVLEDSNVAKINIGIGGVGANIATNLNTLGESVSFISAFGSDLFSDMAINKLEKRNINLENSLQTDENSSVYLAILNEENDLFLGLNDMAIIDELDVAFLQHKHNYINTFNTIVVDNNLTEESIHYLLTTYQDKTIFMDAVSAKKCIKIIPVLQYLDYLKVNQLELETMSSKDNLHDQINDLIEQGVSNLLVTNKGKTIYYASKDELITTIPRPCTNIVNASGAGDAFISGFIHGVNQGVSKEKCLEHAKKLANKTLQVNESTIEKVN